MNKYSREISSASAFEQVRVRIYREKQKGLWWRGDDEDIPNSQLFFTSGGGSGNELNGRLTSVGGILSTKSYSTTLKHVV